MAILDDSRLQTQKSQLQGSIQLLQLQLVQVKAQLNALESQIAAEKGLMNRSITSAVAELSRHQREYRDKQITSQTDVKEAEAAVDLAKEEKTRYQQLANTGAISLLQVKEKEQGFKAALARLERAKASLNPTVASVEIAKERIAQEEARGESTLATLEKERKSLSQRLLEIQNQLNRDQKELQQVENDLKKSVIRAPAFGTILKLELRNSGQVVRPGESLAEIAPNNAALVVKARVAADDISKVGVCQAQKVSDCKQGKVLLRVSAYPYPDYGTLKGKVSAIAPDVTIPKNDGTNTAAPYYEVTIQPERPLLVKGALQYPIQPGMDARADIISREETVLTFILRKARLITDL
ncbi:MAG: HlyD family efflux transporter periplasmic adaptor subunit [Coleofasciculus sp. Co-bin14]|nr:HlyD family efflux transporter periplasmic adaptor subunit [Coleofasciculus sp. Co-bin14]